jgi:hypothetical protein
MAHIKIRNCDFLLSLDPGNKQSKQWPSVKFSSATSVTVCLAATVYSSRKGLIVAKTIAQLYLDPLSDISDFE